jgi:tetratricopeptide (TPR) repeat protein
LPNAAARRKGQASDGAVRDAMSRRTAKPTGREPSMPVRPPLRPRALLIMAVALLAAGGAAWVGAGALARRLQASQLPDLPDLTTFASAVARQIGEAHAAARAEVSAAHVGALAMVYHASLADAPAQEAYALAERLAPGDARWPYYRGLLYEERGEHAAAREAFARATAIDPAHGFAWFHLAEIAFKQAANDTARVAYVRARDAEPVLPFSPAGVTRRTPTALAAHAEFGLARLRLEDGARDEAHAMLADILRRHPRFGAARSLLGQLRTGTVVDAIGAAVTSGPDTFVPPSDPFLDAIVARSQQTDLLLKHAALAGRSGDASWREYLVRRALDVAPDGLDVLMELTSMLQEADRHREALDYLRRAEALAPGDHHVLVEQGRSLSELGRLAEAESILRRAARVRDAAAEYNLGTVLDRMDRWDEARTHYERTLAINPFHARAMNNLAVGLDRRGQTPIALALYARALQADPGNAEVYSNLGSALIGQRRFDEALRALETSLAIEPSAADARNNLGIALAQLGRFPEARKSFEEALRLDPAHENARRNLEALRPR